MLVSHKLEQTLALQCTPSPDIFYKHLKQSGDPGLPEARVPQSLPAGRARTSSINQEVGNSAPPASAHSALQVAARRPPFAEEAWRDGPSPMVCQGLC